MIYSTKANANPPITSYIECCFKNIVARMISIDNIVASVLITVWFFIPLLLNSAMRQPKVLNTCILGNTLVLVSVL